MLTYPLLAAIAVGLIYHREGPEIYLGAALLTFASGFLAILILA